MGRQIPKDRPLSDEDRAHLMMWSQEDIVKSIDESFPPGSSSGEDDDDSVNVDKDISDYAEGLKVAELRKALKDNGFEFDSDDHKDDLVAILAIGLQERRNSGEEVVLPKPE